MTRTCEQCGADALDARGVCRNCGWQASETGFDEDDSAPSLGATRAADVPDTLAAARASRPGAGQGYAPPSLPAAFSGQTARYCGTCGARVGPGEAFCGQCGSPVGSSAGEYGGEYGAGRDMGTSAQSRYYVGEGALWGQDEGDAPTEAFAPSMPYNRPQPAVPYTRPGYVSGAGVPGAYAPARPSRTTRIVVGLLCLLGGVASAIGAIILAIPQK